MKYFTLSNDAVATVLQEMAYPIPQADGTLRSVPLRLRRGEISRVMCFSREQLSQSVQPFSGAGKNQNGHLALHCYHTSASAHLWSMRQRNQLEDGAKPETLILRWCSPEMQAAPDRQGSLWQDSTLSVSLSSAQEQAAACLSPMVELFAVDGIPIERTRVAAVLTVMLPAMQVTADPQQLTAALAQELTLGLSLAAQEGFRFLVLPMDSDGLSGFEPALLGEALLKAFYAPVSEDNASVCDWRWPFEAVAVTHSDPRVYGTLRDCAAAYQRRCAEEKRQQILERIQEDRKKYLSAIRGSLLAGAIGDALGYPVEFLSYDQICVQYGARGIQGYARSRRSGQALISDDTQMTLFTAAGLLRWDTRLIMSSREICSDSDSDILEAYQDWYMCQCGNTAQETGAEWLRGGRRKVFRLAALPQMHSRRAPGNTCLSALQSGDYGTIDNPINHSKGCGGVMRVAPIGLFYRGIQTPEKLRQIGWEAANAAALTHGHPLGYIPAAAFAMMVNRAAFGGCPHEDGLYGIVREVQAHLAQMFGDDQDLAVMEDLLAKAVQLSRNSAPDSENIPPLGEGWVAEEALAIAVYCCLRHPDDLDAALLAAVNHSGDSDSTGAIAGNLLGAWLGAESIHSRWLDDLELLDVLEETAQDLCDHCRIDRVNGYLPVAWLEKYWPEGLA